MTGNVTKDVDAGPMEGLFFTVMQTLEREVDNVFVHGQAVFEFRGVEKRGGRDVPEVLAEWCREMGWFIQTVRNAKNSTVWVTVSSPEVDMALRGQMNGTLARSFVVFHSNKRGMWEEVEGRPVKSPMHLSSTDRRYRRVGFDVECAR